MTLILTKQWPKVKWLLPLGKVPQWSIAIKLQEGVGLQNLYSLPKRFQELHCQPLWNLLYGWTSPTPSSDFLKLKWFFLVEQCKNYLDLSEARIRCSILSIWKGKIQIDLGLCRTETARPNVTRWFLWRLLTKDIPYFRPHLKTSANQAKNIISPLFFTSPVDLDLHTYQNSTIFYLLLFACYLCFEKIHRLLNWNFWSGSAAVLPEVEI